jgi:hypothetical protein
MWLNEDSPVHKRDLLLTKPYVNSAGFLGFAPDSHRMPFLSRLAAFITNPISRRPRQPASARAVISFPGGFLLHTGLPNPGISQAIVLNKRAWAGASLPIIVHLLVETPQSLAEMVRKLEGLENIMAVELGLPPDCDPNALPTFMSAALGELPIILCLSPEQIPIFKETLGEINPAALHLVEPRGTLPGAEEKPILGRLYGPAIAPIMVNAALGLIDAGHRLIVNGEIFDKSQVEMLLSRGVTALGLGSHLWGLDESVLDLAE